MQPIRTLVTRLLLGLVLLPGWVGALVVPESFKERLVVTLPEHVHPDAVHLVAPDLVAYVEISPQGKRRFVVNGKPGQWYAYIRYVRFGPQGLRWAYEAQRDDQWYVVTPGRVYEAFDGVVGGAWRNLLFNESGSVVAFPVKHGARQWINLAGRPIGEHHDEIVEFALSPSGQVAHTRWNGGAALVFLPGREPLGPFECSAPILFSRDDRHVAFAGCSGGKRQIVLDGEPGQLFDEVSNPVFAPDGRAVYAARDGEESFIVVGQERGPSYREIDSIRVSASGVLAYAASDEHGMSMVVDGERGPVFRRVASPSFGPDSRTVAYQAWKGKQSLVVLGDWRSPTFDWPLSDDVQYSHIVFSPDGRRVSYTGRDGEGYFIGIGDERGPLFDGVGLQQFSPDSAVVAYPAMQGGQRFVAVDGRLVGPFDKVGTPLFSSDSQQVGFLALQGREVWWKVVGVAPESAETATAPRNTETLR